MIKTPIQQKALNLINCHLSVIRKQVASRRFDHNRVAEIEINEFIYEGKVVDRIMVVLRATGCAHYLSGNGCSMCAHYDGTTDRPVTKKEYLAQWDSVVSGKAVEEKYQKNFDINNYPIVCLYNLGSLFCPCEVPPKAVKEIFRSINTLTGIKKTIVESRAEYVTQEALKNIREVYSGVVEVGIGLESSNDEVRELCHHKNMPNLKVFENAVNLLHKYDFKALAYVNQKPIFLTEKEAVDDAVKTALYAYKIGADAVSIEPTSLQNHSLTDFLHNINAYRVPWLWSVREVVRGIYKNLPNKKKVDIRIGGYFEEEVLSGSQGVAPGADKNEIFPYETSGNCRHCNNRNIKAIKQFNKTLSLKVLDDQSECPYCYKIWETAMKVKDSRSIPIRIIDTLEVSAPNHGN